MEEPYGGDKREEGGGGRRAPWRSPREDRREEEGIGVQRTC